MKTNSTKIITAAVATLALLTVPLLAADNYSVTGNPATVVKSSSTTNLVVNFPAWPAYIAQATTATNFTKIDISSFKEFAVQATGASTTSAADATNQVIWTFYKAVANTAPTNAAGTSLYYVSLATVTNQLTGTTPCTAVGQWYNTSLAGCSTIYLGTIQVLAGSGSFTNYSLTVFGK